MCGRYVWSANAMNVVTPIAEHARTPTIAAFRRQVSGTSVEMPTISGDPSTGHGIDGQPQDECVERR